MRGGMGVRGGERGGGQHGRGRLLSTFLPELVWTALLHRYEAEINKDYRLNYRLRTACQADVQTLCPTVCQQNDGQVWWGSVTKVAPPFPCIFAVPPSPLCLSSPGALPPLPFLPSPPALLDV